MFEKYRNFSAEDFATDDFFREWVFDKKPNANIFWTKWVGEHPEKREEVIQAIMLLKILRAGENELSPAEIGNAIERTLYKIDKSAPRKNFTAPVAYQKWIRYAAAALILVFIGWGGNKNSWNRVNPAITGISPDEEWLTLENTGSGEKKVTLEDGSQAVLDPGTTIRYRNTTEGERTVYLSGSAFFDVVKDPGRLFKVITEDLVTQVLGTSFKVSSDAVSGETKVRVVTGKVEVSARNSSRKTAGNTIVYPNQEIVFKQTQNQITKALVADPVEIQISEQAEFVYEDIPIGKIFDELGSLYGVTIHYDKELLAGCQITASFGSETFWDKLNLVCRPVRATIEEKNGEIFIESPGCKF